MLNLVVDIGNTFAKVALFDNREIIEQYSSSSLTPAVIERIAGGRTIDRSIVSSVKKDLTDLESYLESCTQCLRFSNSGTFPVNNHYRTPETLGADRLAAVIGAASVFPGRDCLVIDSGTCITYDFIDRNRNYYGGSISPGLQMRFKAMNTFTGKLPLVESDEHFNTYFGDDTTTAIRSGAQNGILFEVKGFIQAYLSNYPELLVALCGGDVKFFDSQLKSSIFAPIVKAVPDLVLIGLNEVICQDND